MAARCLVCLAPLVAAACGTTPPVRRVPPSGPASYFVAITHESEMSQSFRLVGVKVSLDDRVVFEKLVDTESGEGDAQVATPACVYQGMVPAGTHDAAVELLYRGNGFGVFTYLRGYRFTARSTHEVQVPPDAFGVHVTSVGHEGGGATTPLEDRPAVRWLDTVERTDPNAGCRPGP